MLLSHAQRTGCPQNRSPYCSWKWFLCSFRSRRYSSLQGPQCVPKPTVDPLPGLLKNAEGLPVTSLLDPRSEPAQQGMCQLLWASARLASKAAFQQQYSEHSRPDMAQHGPGSDLESCATAMLHVCGHA